jgi:hypothetical protein
MTIAPDSRQRDRVYPALTSVGEGWMIYTPHLRIEDGAVLGRLSIEVPSSWNVVGRRDAKEELVGESRALPLLERRVRALVTTKESSVAARGQGKLRRAPRLARTGHDDEGESRRRPQPASRTLSGRARES